jgi:virginiamycin B lyase
MKHSLKATALLWLLLAAPAAAAPTVTEFDIPTAAAFPQDIVLGPDGKLWFTEKGIDKIGRVTPGNPPLIEEFALPATFTDPFNITVGPDNKIWASASNGGGAVVRMNAANPADTQGKGGYGVATAAGIAAGPDGKIWLGDQTGQVVRINPTDMLEEATSDIPLTGFNVRNLAPGPDGNVWVTDFGGQIGRVTPAGVATPFDVPANSAWDIVTGPDGNVWYPAPDGAPLAGRLTTAGVATEFPLTPVGDPHGITVGPDGALWIALAVGNSIGRITTGGQFSEIKGLTAAARPEYIAAGPDNTLWFTEQDGNRIGRITGIELPQQPQPQPQPQPTPTDTTRPNVTGLRLTRTVFRLGGRGTVIRWTQSEDARVTIRFARRVSGRWRRVRRVMRFQSTAGSHRLRFRGRFDLRHPLRPGRYRMTFTARDAAGNVSAPDRARFRLLPRR